jgi:hypothetical protein
MPTNHGPEKTTEIWPQISVEAGRIFASNTPFLLQE